MSPKFLVNRLEIGFWNTVIPVMKNSSFIRVLAPLLYPYLTKIFNRKSLLQVLFAILLGSALGFSIGMLSQFI